MVRKDNNNVAGQAQASNDIPYAGPGTPEAATSSAAEEVMGAAKGALNSVEAAFGPTAGLVVGNAAVPPPHVMIAGLLRDPVAHPIQYGALRSLTSVGGTVLKVAAGWAIVEIAGRSFAGVSVTAACMNAVRFFSAVGSPVVESVAPGAGEAIEAVGEIADAL